MEYFNFLPYVVFIAALGYYAMSNLQWYSYRLGRVLFHHTKSWWHLVYFVFPFILYMFFAYRFGQGYVVAALYIIMLYIWYRRLDKPLVWTGRVKRFFAILLLLAIFSYLVFGQYVVIMPIVAAFFISVGIEKILFNSFKIKASKRLDELNELKVIGVTASYGKTSIKNYVSTLLGEKYKTYATPRSVNTLGGVLKDINDDLPFDSEIYVVEMGAREQGDIAQIATMVNPHYVVVGKIGPAHIEYFGSMENIRNTKMEIMQSSRVKKAWVHKSANVKPDAKVEIFGDEIKDIEATLNETSFVLDGKRYSAKILGEFNAMNLAVAVKVAKELGLSENEIQKGLASMEPVAHRLQRIDAGGKVILDDSFNGNIDGMMASFDLARTHDGRKVIITPGLVEVDDELNEKVAKRANEVFDLVIVTGDLNYEIFKKYIDSDKLLKLQSKSDMEKMLAEHTKSGDLILFANDAPSFV